MKNTFLLLSFLMLLTFSRVDGQIITTIAGTGATGSTGDGGPATAALLNGPRGLAIDAANNIYVTDMHNQRVRKITTATGIISRVAGDGATGFSGDGGLATLASLQNPYGLRMDNAGNLLIADLNNHVIRRVTISSGIINTIAGIGGVSGNSGNGGPATSAKFYNPVGVVMDPAGNYYIADNQNNVIRKVSSAGIVSIYAGQYGALGYGYAGDGGPAVLAEMKGPFGLALDAAGNLYFADFYNSVIRKVSTSGIISTVAGNGTSGYSGDGGPATSAMLNNPLGLCIDNAGNLYITERNNHVIRKVSAAGIISTVAGAGVAGYGGDGGHAGAAMFDYPAEVAMDTAGYLIVCDFNNHRVRKIGGVSITVLPNDTVCAGTMVTFTAHTLGNGPVPHYTWRKNGVALGADSTNYSIVVATGDVVECSLATGAISNPITMTVLPLPVAAAITGTDSVCQGATIVLASASGGGTWTSGSTGTAAVSGGVVTGVAGGTVTITYSVTNSCGTATATKLITVNPLPVVAPIAGASTVCVGSNLTLSDATPGGSWWAGSGGATVAGGVVTGVYAGVVTITYAVSNSCGSTPVTMNITVESGGGCVSQVSSEEPNAITAIYPNPSQGQFSVALPSGAAMVTVTDLYGRVIAEHCSSGNSVLALDISDAPDGLYLVKVVSEGGMYTARVVVSKGAQNKI